jgi:hypothetical protein
MKKLLITFIIFVSLFSISEKASAILFTTFSPCDTNTGCHSTTTTQNSSVSTIPPTSQTSNSNTTPKTTSTLTLSETELKFRAIYNNLDQIETRLNKLENQKVITQEKTTKENVQIDSDTVSNTVSIQTQKISWWRRFINWLKR